MYSTTCFFISAVFIILGIAIFILTLKFGDIKHDNVAIGYMASTVGILVGVLVLIHGIRFLGWENVCGFSSFVISQVM